MTLSDARIKELLTAAYPSVQPPPDLEQSLLADLQKSTPATRHTISRSSYRWWLAAAACLLVIPGLFLVLRNTAHPASSGTPSADRAYISLEWQVEACPVVVLGKVEKIQEEARKERSTYDACTLRITEVLKNANADPAIKAGDTLTFYVLARAIRHPDSFTVNIGDEGIWILHRSGTLLIPEARLESARRQEILDLLPRLATDQAANKERVLKEWAAHKAVTIPPYDLTQFQADLIRGPHPTLATPWAVPFRDADTTQGWVFLDPHGQVTLATRYHTRTYGFSSGLAPVSTTVDKDNALRNHGYIDPTGKLAIPAVYEWTGPFIDDHAVVQKDGKFGLIDSAGKTVLPCAYRLIYAHTADVAQVILDDSMQLIDLHTGAVLFSTSERNMMGKLSEGLLQVNVAAHSIPSALPSVHAWSDRWIGFINIKGQFAVDCGQAAAKGIHPNSHNGFHEGFVPAQAGNQWGYLASDGTLATPPKFLAANDFSEGLAAVATPGEDYRIWRWGYIDRRGETVIPPAYEMAHPFSDGLAAVRQIAWVKNPEIPGAIMRTLRWGFIDKTGTMVIPPFFTSATEFRNGLAYVQEDNRYGCVDKTGRYVWYVDNPW